jgi:hypothetical protein
MHLQRVVQHVKPSPASALPASAQRQCGAKAIAASAQAISTPPHSANRRSPSRDTSCREAMANANPPSPNSMITAPAADSDSAKLWCRCDAMNANGP